MQENLEFMQEERTSSRAATLEDGYGNSPQRNARKAAATARYAYSIKTSRVKEPDFPYHGKPITATSELIEFLRSLKDADDEMFVTIYLDAQNKLIGIQTTKGIVNQAVVYPRQVIRQALLVNASAMILAHNHPSGNPRPSDADLRLTRTIHETAKFMEILVHDHVIIGGETGKFFSMREEGVMP